MKSSEVRSARQAAWEVLCRSRAGGDAAEQLHLLLDSTDRSGQATDLVYGVLRNITLIDTLLSTLASLRKSNVKPQLWTILRLGVYELIYAPKTADYAILNEAVEMARRIGSQKSAGFVNAVLRQLQRQIAVRDAATIPPGKDGRAVIPRSDGSVCILTSAILPDPTAAPDDYLHSAWSLPLWLVREWLTVYGADSAAQICRASNRHPSVYAWPNTGRICAEKLAEQLTAEGAVCRLWPERGAVQVHGGALHRLKAFEEGLFYVQDPTAQAVAAFLEPKPGQTLVDVCAAPGGKSIALSLAMQDNGCILASDVSGPRLERLEQNIRRLELSCIRSVPESDLESQVTAAGHIDALILDVPCSNTGVLARRVEARQRLEQRVGGSLIQSQQALLQKAAEMLSTGAKLLYSTCSILPCENEEQIQQFLHAYPSFVLRKQQLTLPNTEKAAGFDCDGGYMALMMKV